MSKIDSLKALIKAVYLRGRGLLLRVLSLFLFVQKKPFEKNEVREILVIKKERIGDLIVSLPALKYLRQNFPQAEITILINGNTADLMRLIHWADKFIIYRGFFKTIRILRKKKFDLAIDLLMDYPVLTALLTAFSKAKISAGFDIASRGFLFDIKFTPAFRNKRIGRYLAGLIAAVIKEINGDEKAGYEEAYPAIRISPEDKKYIEDFLISQGVRENDILIGIHPGGNYPSQRWPVERFSAIADRVIKQYQAKAIVLAGPNEEALAYKLTGLMQNQAIMAVGFPLDRLVGLISFLGVFIGNNSGPLHIACALNVSTVSTMGPTDPWAWWPGGENHIVLRKGLPCSPCQRPVCRSFDCMKLITVDQMMEAVDIQMKKTGRQK